MPRVKVPINGGWQPDKLAHEMPPGGLVTCKNAVPYNGLYVPFKAASTASATTTLVKPNVALAVIADSDSNNDTYVFLLGPTKIYRGLYDSSAGTIGTFSDVTKGGGVDYGAVIGELIRYGNWIVAAVGILAEVGPQKLTNITAGANFEDLGGTPYKAEMMLLFHEHLILGSLYDAGAGLLPRTLQISAYQAIETWATTFTLTNGASLETFNDTGGVMTALAHCGNQAFLVGFEGSVSIGWWSGYPNWISFAKNRFSDVGVIPGSVVSTDAGAFFLGFDDVYFTDGQTCYGLNCPAKDTVIRVQQMRYIISGAQSTVVRGYHWKDRGCIMWAYASTTSLNFPDNILIYNYREKRWSYIYEASAKCFFEVRQTSTRPQLGAVITTNFTTGQASCKLFDGNNMSMTLETGELSADDKIIQVTSVRPKVPTSDATTAVRVGTRMNEYDAVTYSTSTAPTDGKVDVLQSGRYARVELTADVNVGNEISVDYNIVGER